MNRLALLTVRLSLFFIVALLFSGCERNSASTPVPSGKQLFAQSVKAVHFESANAALGYWRTFNETKPTLVLFSNDPFLKLVPDSAQDVLKARLEQATDAELQKELDHLQPAPLALPEMTVTAALLKRMFREVVWVVSAEPSITTRMPDFMTNQLEAYGAFGVYSPIFRKKDGVFSGHLYETPLRFVGHDNLIDIEGPVVVHVDLSHFSPLYKDEVRTPLLKVLKEFATDIRKQQWDTVALSLSSSNLDGRMPLASRSISPILAQLAKEPSLLDGEIPASWDKLSQALYQETFFQMESVLELYKEVAQLDPRNAYAHYGAYRALKQMKQPEKALSALAQACLLDPVYAVEYQQLASQALQSDQYLLAIDMLQLAKRSQPNNIFIDLQLAETYAHFQKRKPGLELIGKLQNIAWSPHYYSGIANRLLEWKEHLTMLKDPSSKEH